MEDDDERRLGPVLTLPEPQIVGTDSGGFCARLFPFGFKSESLALFKLAWPLSLSILFHYLIQPISLAFCGHLGPHELSSVAMAISVIYVLCVSFGRGLAFGCDTYFSQTYGSSNKMMMGIYLQKGFIFGVFLSCFLAALMLNVESILLLTRQDPMIARNAGDYCFYFLPGVLAYSWLFMLMRYLLCQNKVLPNFFICVLCCGFCALLHYGLLFQADMGIRGSAIALMSSYYLVLIMFLTYIWGSGIYVDTWPGWSWEALLDWGPFAWTCLSSMAMTFLFWMCTEVGTYLSGGLGERDIATFQIMFQVEGFAWMLPLGLGGAATARMGQYLGANQPQGAITTARVSLVLIMLVSVLLSAACYLLKAYIPRLFTNDPNVYEYTTSLFPILAIFLLLEGFEGVGMGLVRGSGRQALGTGIVFVSYYLVALPIGIPLMFKTDLKQAGLWWGYVIGLVIQCLLSLAFVIKLNWTEEARKAQIRAGTGVAESSSPTEAYDERSHLLGGSNIQSSGTYEMIGATPRPSTRFLLGRLAILLFFLAILAAGILLRMYVKVDSYTTWSDICINGNGTYVTSSYMTSPSNASVIIPPCNETTFRKAVPLYGMWQGMAIP